MKWGKSLKGFIDMHKRIFSRNKFEKEARKALEDADNANNLEDDDIREVTKFLFDEFDKAQENVENIKVDGFHNDDEEDDCDDEEDYDDEAEEN